MTRREISEKLIGIYKDKNKDYGNSAHRTFVEFGEVALVIRISDKLSRLQTLMDGGEQMVKDESVLDTLGDAVTYLCMLAAEIACDMPDLPDCERFECDENINSTISYLSALGGPSHNLPPLPPDVSYYRDELLTIWRCGVDAGLRMDEYLLLADQLMDEIEKRVV